MPDLLERITNRLRTHGGVLLAGPKAVGKTTTAVYLPYQQCQDDTAFPGSCLSRSSPSLSDSPSTYGIT